MQISESLVGCPSQGEFSNRQIIKRVSVKTEQFLQCDNQHTYTEYIIFVSWNAADFVNTLLQLNRWNAQG